MLGDSLDGLVFDPILQAWVTERAPAMPRNSHEQDMALARAAHEISDRFAQKCRDALRASQAARAQQQETLSGQAVAVNRGYAWVPHDCVAPDLPVEHFDNVLPESRDHLRRRYMSFHRMVTTVLAEEAPNAKVVTDFGKMAGYRTFFAEVLFPMGIRRTYEKSAEQSYDGAAEASEFEDWVQRWLLLVGKKVR